jgi:hypothetical protein
MVKPLLLLVLQSLHAIKAPISLASQDLPHQKPLQQLMASFHPIITLSQLPQSLTVKACLAGSEQQNASQHQHHHTSTAAAQQTGSKLPNASR